MHRFRRFAPVHAAALFLSCAVSIVGATQVETYQFTIPAQELDSALRTFARQAHQQVVFDGAVVQDKTSGTLIGAYTADAGLQILLADSGLKATRGEPGIVMVRQDAGVASNGTDAGSPTEPVLDEVLVTAQKRIERLQDVPVPVSAVSAETLVNSNQLRLQDYYSKVPGLSLTFGTADTPRIAIRGVTTGGATNPTVGITVDDVPYGSSTGLGGGYTAPDIDPSELSRVEVLRGPQGTLYGASSIGGLLKFVTIDPSTDAVSGRVQAGVNGVRNGDELGYTVRGSVNVPLSDTWAVRASAFTRTDPGYIDDPSLGKEGVNEAEVHGGRLSALWRPSQSLSLKLSALLQQTSADSASNVYVQPGLGDLEQTGLLGFGGYRNKTQVYHANVAAKVGELDLVSISGYSINQHSESVDYSAAFGPLLTAPMFGVTGTPILDENKTTKFTQEVRLSSAVGPTFDWLFGVFYTHEDSPHVQRILATDPATGAQVAEALYVSFPTKYQEYAAFADLTFHLTERFDVQVGGRESRNEQRYSQVESGPFVPVLVGVPSPLINPEVNTDETSFTYLVTPRFKISPDLMIYARLASGYRPGGPNVLSTVNGLPADFNPDKTQNYELGVKGSVWDHALSFDASLYSIDWKDIQLSLFQRGNSYIANASRARSRGIELSADLRPVSGLTIGAWVAWNDAELREGFPTSSAYGVSGDRLPNSSRFSGSFSADKEFPLPNGMVGFVGGSVSYVGERVGLFQLTPLRQTFPAYARTDVRAGVRYETWLLNLYVNNVTDRRGLLAGGLDTFPSFAFNYIQPRTAGVSLAKTF